MKGFVINDILINMNKVLYMNYDKEQRTLEVDFGESSIIIHDVNNDIYYQMRDSLED